MTNPLANQNTMANIRKSKAQQLVFRWGVTIAVVTLAGFGYWGWAWLVLALAAFASMIDLGLAMVIGQVTQAATAIAVGNKNRETR